MFELFSMGSEGFVVDHTIMVNVPAKNVCVVAVVKSAKALPKSLCLGGDDREAHGRDK